MYNGCVPTSGPASSGCLRSLAADCPRRGPHHTDLPKRTHAGGHGDHRLWEIHLQGKKPAWRDVSGDPSRVTVALQDPHAKRHPKRCSHYSTDSSLWPIKVTRSRLLSLFFLPYVLLVAKTCMNVFCSKIQLFYPFNVSLLRIFTDILPFDCILVYIISHISVSQH